jgi:hypothetical protein
MFTLIINYEQDFFKDLKGELKGVEIFHCYLISSVGKIANKRMRTVRGHTPSNRGIFLITFIQGV